MIQKIVDLLLLKEKLLVGDLDGVVIGRHQTDGRDDGQCRQELHLSAKKKKNFPRRARVEDPPILCEVRRRAHTFIHLSRARNQIERS